MSRLCNARPIKSFLICFVQPENDTIKDQNSLVLWSRLLNNFNKISMKNFRQKIFCPCIYCLKCYAELKNDIFKQYSLYFQLVTIVEQLQQNFHEKTFIPSFYCLKYFTQLKNDIFKQQNPFFWMVTIVEQLQQNFHGKIFVRKYFVLVFIV